MVKKEEKTDNKEVSNKKRENITHTSKNVNNEHNINSNNKNSPNSNQIAISNSSLQNNNKIVEQKLELNEYTKYYVEFLIRLFCSEDKLSAKIKNSNKFEIKEEKCYIINYKLIEIYEQTFKAEYLKMLLNSDNYYNTINKKYKNKYEYISENYMNEFIRSVMLYIPQEYIKQINGLNYSSFTSSIKNKELYSPSRFIQKIIIIFYDC